MAIGTRPEAALPTVYLGTSQNVTVSGSSAQSTAFGTAGIRYNVLVRLVSTTNCRFVTGANPTATSTSTYLPAGLVEFTEIKQGDKLAVIQDSAGGTLNITACVIVF